MTEDEVFTEYLSTLPTEVLLSIFIYLPGKQLIRCRQVCVRWQQIVDELVRNDMLWRDHCIKDFPTVYKAAKIKAQSDLPWFNIYKSLSLWPCLPSAREVRNEFAPSSFNEQIKDCFIFRDGNGITIAVHKLGSIVYYDLDTLVQNINGTILGEYMKYTENEDTIIIQSFQLHLFVTRKIIHKPDYEKNVTFDQVKIYHFVGREIYYVNLNNEIFVCNLEDKVLKSTFIKRSEESIISLGYKGCLHILTVQRNIYATKDNNLELVCCLDSRSNMVNQLNKYDLLDQMDWQSFFKWVCILRRKIPFGPLQHITVVRTYGDIVFVGCNWGILHIYYKPYSNGEFDFYRSEPLKQYNFIEKSGCPVLSTGPIMQIEVSETEFGHKVFIAMPKKIVVLEYIHNFYPLQQPCPYSDEERVKIEELKIEEVNKF